MDPDFVTLLFVLLGSCGFPSALPLIFGAVILKNYGKDSVNRLLGFLTLRTFLVLPVILSLYGLFFYDWSFGFLVAIYLLVTVNCATLEN